MLLKVGLTGGIGSGKSTVAKIFSVLGIPVYYADIEAKRLMNEDPDLKKNIIDVFGETAYMNDQLNRSYISSIVFNQPERLKLLNELVHPVTKKDGEAWIERQTTPYAIHEAALIFEANVNEKLDYVIGVSSPIELRVKRAMDRDNVTAEEVKKRMSRQMNEEIKMSKCDFILYNDEKQLLIPQVISLHEQLLTLSKQLINE